MPTGTTPRTTRRRHEDKRHGSDAERQEIRPRLGTTGNVLPGLRLRDRRQRHRARRSHQDPRGDRRIAGAAMLLPERDLRLLRHARERPGHARVQHEDHRRAALERRPRRRRADGQHGPRQGPRRGLRPVLGQGPRRQAVAPAGRPGTRGRVPRPERGHAPPCGRDVLHHVRRVRLRLHRDGGRRQLPRPRSPRQGVPLCGRSARRRRQRAARRAQRVRRRLGLHAVYAVRGGLPQGRRADGPDHGHARSGHGGGLHQHLRREARHWPSPTPSSTAVVWTSFGSPSRPSASSTSRRCSSWPLSASRRSLRASVRPSSTRRPPASRTSAIYSKNSKKSRTINEVRLLSRVRVARRGARTLRFHDGGRRAAGPRVGLRADEDRVLHRVRRPAGEEPAPRRYPERYGRSPSPSGADCRCSSSAAPARE